MVDIGTLLMKIKADTSNFDKGMDRVSGAVKSAAKALGVATIATGAAVGAFSVKALEMGADAEEVRNKYDVVFKGMTETVDDWSEQFSKAVGRSKFDIQESVANLADLQQGLGMTKEESFDLSKNIISLSTDLASFNNLSDAEAIDAMSKAMLGEAESAKKLGLLLNVDRVKAFAEAQGKVYGELTDSERAMMVYNLALSQSENAIGDAERSAGSFTNQMKALKSSAGDITTTLGMKLIPIATTLVTTLNENLTPAFEKVSAWWADNGDTIKDKAKTVFDGVKDAASTAWTFYNDKLLPIFTKVKDYVVDNYPQIKETVSSVMESVEQAIDPVVELIDKRLIKALDDLDNKDMQPFLTGIENTFQAAANMINIVTEAVDLLLVGLDRLNELMPDAPEFQTTLEDFTPIGIMKNMGLIQDKEYEDKVYREAMGLPSKEESQNAVVTPSSFNMFDRINPIKDVKKPESVINMYINGNTIMNERDMDLLGNGIVRQLKLGGVK